jgi:hypothetical protein
MKNIRKSLFQSGKTPRLLWIVAKNPDLPGFLARRTGENPESLPSFGKRTRAGQAK